MNQNVYEMIKERKEYLDALLKRTGLTESLKVVGDTQKPAFVWNDDYKLPMYVKNFHLIFNDKPFGNEVHRVKLSYKTHLDMDWFNEWVEEVEVTPMYKISLKVPEGCPALYLSGFNYTDRANKKGKYPVFSSEVPRLFFNESKAVETVMEYDHYPLYVE